MPTITVFTATYNRRHTLARAYDSLKNQTCKDFEWLIIDDGSIDGTQLLIEEFKEDADFAIRYYWKENGGRHTAVNYSYPLIDSPYVVTLDSDDELTHDAIELMLKAWSEIPEKDYDRFWCVSGRSRDSQTGEVAGELYPEEINDLKGKAQRKVLLKISGEKHCCRKTDVLIQYPFPVFKETKFTPENMVWEQINRKYDQYCVNDVYSLYHTESPDGICNGGTHSSTMTYSIYYAGLFYINELFDEFFYNKFVARYLVYVPRSAILEKIPLSRVLASINAWYKKLLVMLGYPVAKMLILANKY